MCINNRGKMGRNNGIIEMIYFMKYAVMAIFIFIIFDTCYAGMGYGQSATKHNCTAFIWEGTVAFNDLHGHVDEGQEENWHHYSVYVPQGVSNLHVQNDNGTGDADLYTSRMGIPRLADWDCRPYGYGNVEACVADNLTTETDYYFSLNTESIKYKGSDLVVNYKIPTANGVNVNRKEGFG